MNRHEAYNPLDYNNLLRDCLRELIRRGVNHLPLREEFSGAGVYVLYYVGESPLYSPIKTNDEGLEQEGIVLENGDEQHPRPIYVGKAVPRGARQGATSLVGVEEQETLSARIAHHVESIRAVAPSLALADFRCRFLVVEPLWIPILEQSLISHYKPPWNSCISGFGKNPPGGKRPGAISWWDTLHPGRPWTAGEERDKTRQEVVVRLRHFLETGRNLSRKNSRRLSQSE